jgi:hypothetical protein
MYLKNRNFNEYLDNLKLFIKAVEADKLDKSKSDICCPCVDYKNTNSMDVYAHLIIRGFMSDYRCWNMHREEEEGAQREEEDEGARVQREKKEVAVRGRGIKGVEEEAQLFFIGIKGPKFIFLFRG